MILASLHQFQLPNETLAPLDHGSGAKGETVGVGCVRDGPQAAYRMVAKPGPVSTAKQKFLSLRLTDVSCRLHSRRVSRRLGPPLCANRRRQINGLGWLLQHYAYLGRNSASRDELRPNDFPFV